MIGQSSEQGIMRRILHFRLWRKPASAFPLTTSPSVPGYAAAAVYFLVLLICSVSVSMSDGASVPISNDVNNANAESSTSTSTSTMTTGLFADHNYDTDLESLATSKILMDHTSSSSSAPTPSASELKIMGSILDSKLRLVEELKKNSVTAAAEGAGDDNKEDEKEEEGMKKNQNVTVTLSGSGSTPRQGEEQESSYSSSSPKNDRNSYEMSSPLHVARCRATCLQKFLVDEILNVDRETTTPTSKPETAPPTSQTSAVTSAEEMHLLPMLRLKRKKRSSSNGNFGKSAKSCFQKASECLTCWESCKLLEPKDGKLRKEEILSSHTSSGQVNEEPMSQDQVKNEEEGDETKKNGRKSKSKQSIFTCSLLESRQCLAGCQVACSFYDRLLTEKGRADEETGSGNGPQGKAFKSNPVVATRHESVVKIVPGKITWPSQSDMGDKAAASTKTLRKDEQGSTSPGQGPTIPVVYVVIQEYPDRKWRQIAQTTEPYIDIPSELTNAMSTKLRSIRVLVVGPSGLLSVYSPDKVGQGTLSDNNNNNNLAKPQQITTSRAGPTTTTTTGISNTTPTAKTTGNAGASATENAVDPSVPASSPSVTTSLLSTVDSDSTPTTSSTGTDLNDHEQSSSTNKLPSSADETEEDGSLTDFTPMTTTTQPDNELGGDAEPFGLRVVSLIHQKSLVIAELKWDEIEGNPIPNQEYLITWELTGGGLKGHLVTDSTSVTLSLWPDTKYQIQVEQFQQNFDSDGEQPTESSTTSLKSLPLIVDTGEASFPLSQPSALLSSATEEEDEDDYEDEDVSAQEGNETREVEEEDPNHKSISRGFLNMTLLLGITISALVFVLVILTVAAFTWTKMRAFSSDSYMNGTESGSNSPMLTPTKNPSNFYDYYSHSPNRKGCCYEERTSSFNRTGCRCSSPSSSFEFEPQPLLSAASEEYCWEDCGPSPVYYGMSLSAPYSETSCGKDSDNFYYSFERDFLRKKGPRSGGVAVISSCNNGSSPLQQHQQSSSFLTGAPRSCSYWNYYNKLSSSSNMAYSLLGDDCATSSNSISGCGTAPGKQLECPSSSFGSTTTELP